MGDDISTLGTLAQAVAEAPNPSCPSCAPQNTMNKVVAQSLDRGGKRMDGIEETLRSIDTKLDANSRFDVKNWWHVLQVGAAAILAVLWLISTLRSGDTAKMERGLEILLKSQGIDLSAAVPDPVVLARQPTAGQTG